MEKEKCATETVPVVYEALGLIKKETQEQIIRVPISPSNPKNCYDTHNPYAVKNFVSLSSVCVVT